MNPLAVQSAVKTHTGHYRSQNEDRYLIRTLDRGLLLAVADGLGGEADGDVAAQIVCDHLAAWRCDGNDPQAGLAACVERADREIRGVVAEFPEREGMGTTATAVFLVPGATDDDGNPSITADWVHVGDTRLYRWRAGQLHQITTDDNMAQSMVEEGILTRGEARRHSSRHFLYQTVGGGFCSPTTGRLRLEPGDRLLLSSDGLHDEISEREITKIVTAPVSLAKAADRLIDAALAVGGRDNITVILATV